MCPQGEDNPKTCKGLALPCILRPDLTETLTLVEEKARVASRSLGSETEATHRLAHGHAGQIVNQGFGSAMAMVSAGVAGIAAAVIVGRFGMMSIAVPPFWLRSTKLALVKSPMTWSLATRSPP